MLSELEPIIFDAPAGRDVKIYPIADLHYGSMQFNMKRWENFVAKIINEPDTYLVIVGDMVDNGLKSSVTSTYTQTTRPADQKRWVAEQLKPFKDRIIAGVQGNHEHRSTKDADDDPLYDVFAKLDIEDRYRENGCFLAIRIGKDRNKNSTYRPAYSFCVTHGAGGGMYIGSALNRNERFVSAMDGVDVLITGHTHKPATFAGSKIVFDPQNKKVSTKQFYSVVASSWLNYGGYAMKKMYTPTAQTLTEIRLSSHGKDIRVTM